MELQRLWINSFYLHATLVQVREIKQLKCTLSRLPCNKGSEYKLGSQLDAFMKCASIGPFFRHVGQGSGRSPCRGVSVQVPVSWVRRRCGGSTRLVFWLLAPRITLRCPFSICIVVGKQWKQQQPLTAWTAPRVSSEVAFPLVGQSPSVLQCPWRLR